MSLKDLLWSMGIWEDLSHDQHITLQNFVDSSVKAGRIKQLRMYMNSRCGCLNCDAIADDLAALTAPPPQLKMGRFR